ncbi:hypothetical protein DAEQUDRAFT_761059 [Daedalea quercina L-15889]|uniref:Uncharacterized protein n=1 Tax=Daedalea quercina L-15889 TaxID=1314783 RepID=A0A165ULK7_9APHY|nr:hypothetical protein DAEQUDRAFT_761059 [Daedalea quercina L-15889]
MADKLVRTHTNQSNRAKAKDALERKVVFRSVLDNPFRVQWPSVPVNVQNTILARLIDMLHGVREYRLEFEKQNRRKRQRQFERNAASRAFKRPRLAPSTTDTIGIVPESTVTESSQPAQGAAGNDGTDIIRSRPDVLDHLTSGINEVTRLLEKTAHSLVGTSVSTSSDGLPSSEARPSVVLVCRGDVSPPALIQHVPHLVAACNTRGMRKDVDSVHLIPLPKGAEATLAEAFGLRRVSIVAVHAGAPRLSELTALLQTVLPPTASWLAAPTDATLPLVPTHIKQLRTTAPKDMKAAKEQRVRGRTAAKDRERAKKEAQKARASKT